MPGGAMQISPSSSEEGFGVVARDSAQGCEHHPAATRSGYAEPSLAAPPLKRRGLLGRCRLDRLESFHPRRLDALQPVLVED